MPTSLVLLDAHAHFRAIAQHLDPSISATPNVRNRDPNRIYLNLGRRKPILPPSEVVFGVRLLNRYQRLRVVEKAGFPVVPYAEATADLTALQAAWGEVIYKKDISHFRRHVYLVDSSFDRSEVAVGDVFMQRVKGDFSTYKVQLLFGRYIGNVLYKTLSVTDPNFKVWQPIHRWDVPADLVERLEAVSREFTRYGCGYLSIDMMRMDDEYAAIEANTNSVSREDWTTESGHAERFAAAINAFIPSIVKDEYCQATVANRIAALE